MTLTMRYLRVGLRRIVTFAPFALGVVSVVILVALLLNAGTILSVFRNVVFYQTLRDAERSRSDGEVQCTPDPPTSKMSPKPRPKQTTLPAGSSAIAPIG